MSESDLRTRERETLEECRNLVMNAANWLHRAGREIWFAKILAYGRAVREADKTAVDIILSQYLDAAAHGHHPMFTRHDVIAAIEALEEKG